MTESLLFIPALAYLGPGGVLSSVGGLIALGAAVLLALVGFIWYPVKRMLRGRKQQEAESQPDEDPQA